MCIQRIVAGKDHARDEGRAVRDGDIQTACQQTCPTQAITFGNLKDEGSAVSQARARRRARYHVLDELGTRPGVTYLRKVIRAGAEPAPARGRGTHERRAAAASSDRDRRRRHHGRADVRRRQPRRPGDAAAAGQSLLRLDVRGRADPPVRRRWPGRTRSSSAWARPASARRRCGRCTSPRSCSGSVSATPAR